MGNSSSLVFYNCTSLSILNIGSNVITIPDYAFYGCSKLTTLDIPSLVTSIGISAFYGCGLKTVNFNPTNCTVMGNSSTLGVFALNLNLRTLNIGNNVTTIPDYAFRGCNMIKSITIPTMVTSIGSNAFKDCNNLATVNYNATNCTTISKSFFTGCNPYVLNIGSNVTTIPSFAFTGLNLLRSITIPSSVTSIGSSSFSYCTKLISISIPSSVTSIGSYAFNNCSELTSVTIPESVTSIENSTFSGCGKLTSITIPAMVTSIGDNAFNRCIGLTSITIPPLVTSIGISAFSGCIWLGTIYAKPIFPPLATTSVFDGVKPYLFVPMGTVNLYKAANGWMSITNITDCGPTITTTAISNVTATTAKTGGNVTSVGIFDITAEYGVCWSTTMNPSISSSRTTDGTGLGTFISSITGLLQGTVYYYCAYATNSYGTNYGEIMTFTTLDLPKVTTTVVTSITSNSATLGGNITSDGGAATTRGICWSTTSNPTIINSKTINGSGTGIFTSLISGLTQGTIYHFRAYATNAVGTSYGSVVTDTTLTTPTLTTTSISAIKQKTAVSGGEISADGGAAVTARGVCWSTLINPTISYSKTTNGTGIGAFTSSLINLLPLTTYHVRAYATNTVGTSYGEDVTFKTASITAISETKAESLNVYPNPSNGKLTLKISSDIENNCTVSLINPLGQKVYESLVKTSELNIDLKSNNFKGLYFLQLYNEHGLLLGERKIVFK